MNWTTITLRQYQQIHPVLSSDDTDEQKLTQIVFILEGKDITAAEYESKVNEYKFLTSLDIRPKKLSRIKVNGRMYRINYDVAKMPAARYIEIKTFMSDDFVSNIDRIFASMVIPQRKTWYGKYVDAKYEAENHRFYANDMKDANFTDLYSSLVFFCLRLPSSISSFHLSSKHMTKMMRKAEAQAMTILSESITDGFFLQKR